MSVVEAMDAGRDWLRLVVGSGVSDGDWIVTGARSEPVGKWPLEVIVDRRRGVVLADGAAPPPHRPGQAWSCRQMRPLPASGTTDRRAHLGGRLHGAQGRFGPVHHRRRNTPRSGSLRSSRSSSCTCVAAQPRPTEPASLADGPFLLRTFDYPTPGGMGYAGVVPPSVVSRK